MILLLGIALQYGINSNTNNVYATGSTLSLSIDNSTVSIDIASLSQNGTFKKSSSSTISASTNNATGYTLSIAGSGGDNNSKLVNGEAKLNSITEATTESQFSALSGTAYNNMWGYLPSKYCTNATDTTTCTTNTDFLPAPSASGDILDVTSTPNTNNTPNEYQLAIGARVDSTTKIGAYTNTFNVILLANEIPYTITYYDSVIGNMPVDVNTVSPTTSVTISNNEPTRTGYTFAGWCTVAPTTNATGNDTCSGTTYAKGSTYALDQTSSHNDLELYAMWGGGEADYCTGSNYDCMQYLPSNLCTTTMSQVIDKRDGEIYNIQRLADGKCWLLDNLRLDLTATSLATLQNNTNASDKALYYLKNGGGSGQYARNAVSSAWINSNQNSLFEPYIAVAYKDTVAKVKYGSGSGKIGVYYNYCAASAGSYCYTTSSGTNNNASQDVCPSGWHIPTGGSASAEYNNLYDVAYSGNPTNFRNALSTPLSGYFASGTATSQDDSGYTWASVRTDYYRMYSTVVNSSAVNPQRYFTRIDGFSVRCVANNN